MSRRSRRRRGAEGSRWLGKAAVGLLCLALVGLAVSYVLIRRYLHSESFRKFLSAEAGEMAHVTGEFAPFHWDGLAVRTDSFRATGDGLVSGVQADGLHTEIGLGGLRRGVWEVRGSSVRRLDVSLDATVAAGAMTSFETVEENKTKKSQSRSGWLPRDAEVEQIDIQELLVKATLQQGVIAAEGMSVHGEQAGAKNAYRVEVDGGSFHLPFKLVPELKLKRALARYQDGQVFLTKANLNVWENGRVEATGEWNVAEKRFSLEGNATGVNCSDLLDGDWAKRLTGDVVGDFSLNIVGDAVNANGTLTVQNGVLTALPVLDVLAAYADTRRFRTLTLSDASAKWRWRPGELTFTDIALASEGLVRLEGRMTIRGESVDGQFRLGLAPGTLASIPGAETDVFVKGERNLLWAPLHITGTLDDLHEDLTDRLVAAAGGRMFEIIPETGEKVIRFSKTVLEQGAPKAVDAGVKIIDQGTKAVQDAGDLLNGLLGNEPEKKP